MYDPQPGHRVSEYVLDERIGSGSFGQVWKAHHHIWTEQLVAVKVPTDAQYVRNLQREGATVHGLRHPNIVRAIGLDPFADPPYFVMEYVDGVSLRDLIKRHTRGMPPAMAREILRGLLHALGHAHAAGVIHRDVKPENILIAAGPDRSLDTVTSADVKVTDFGLGLAEQVTASSLMQSGSLVAETGRSITGTIAYMSPEQRDGEQVDARSDLYAVGIILFEMLTGERPSGSELPSHVRHGLPHWADALFSRLYTRRDRRFPSAEDVLAALERGAPAAAGPVPPIIRPPTGDEAVTGSGVRCTQCGHPSMPGDNFCILCGQQLVSQPRQCGTCGAFPDPDDYYCIFCGTAVVSHTA